MASTPSSDSTSPHDDGRKRVAKACDRCRLKKIKCDGKIPCSRCQSENTVCRFGERKKSIERRIPPGYVEYLEEQQKILVKALKKTWQEYATPGPKLKGVSDPPIHSIMEDLGVLADFASHRSYRDGFKFEEDLEKVRRQCEEAEASDSAKMSSRSSSSIPDEASLMQDHAFNDPWVPSQPTTPHQHSFPVADPMAYHQRQPPANWPKQHIQTTHAGGPFTVDGVDMDWATDFDMTGVDHSHDAKWQTISPNMLSMPPNNWEAGEEEWNGWVNERSEGGVHSSMVIVG